MGRRKTKSKRNTGSFKHLPQATSSPQKVLTPPEQTMLIIKERMAQEREMINNITDKSHFRQSLNDYDSMDVNNSHSGSSSPQCFASTSNGLYKKQTKRKSKHISIHNNAKYPLEEFNLQELNNLAQKLSSDCSILEGLFPENFQTASSTSMKAFSFLSRGDGTIHYNPKNQRQGLTHGFTLSKQEFLDRLKLFKAGLSKEDDCCCDQRSQTELSAVDSILGDHVDVSDEDNLPESFPCGQSLQSPSLLEICRGESEHSNPSSPNNNNNIASTRNLVPESENELFLNALISNSVMDDIDNGIVETMLPSTKLKPVLKKKKVRRKKALKKKKVKTISNHPTDLLQIVELDGQEASEEVIKSIETNSVKVEINVRKKGRPPLIKRVVSSETIPTVSEPLLIEQIPPTMEELASKEPNLPNIAPLSGTTELMETSNIMAPEIKEDSAVPAKRRRGRKPSSPVKSKKSTLQVSLKSEAPAPELSSSVVLDESFEIASPLVTSTVAEESKNKNLKVVIKKGALKVAAAPIPAVTLPRERHPRNKSKSLPSAALNRTDLDEVPSAEEFFHKPIIIKVKKQKLEDVPNRVGDMPEPVTEPILDDAIIMEPIKKRVVKRRRRRHSDYFHVNKKKRPSTSTANEATAAAIIKPPLPPSGSVEIKESSDSVAAFVQPTLTAPLPEKVKKEELSLPPRKRYRHMSPVVRCPPTPRHRAGASTPAHQAQDVLSLVAPSPKHPNSGSSLKKTPLPPPKKRKLASAVSPNPSPGMELSDSTADAAGSSKTTANAKTSTKIRKKSGNSSQSNTPNVDFCVGKASTKKPKPEIPFYKKLRTNQYVGCRAPWQLEAQACACIRSDSSRASQMLLLKHNLHAAKPASFTSSSFSSNGLNTDQLDCGDACLNRLVYTECVQGICPCDNLCTNQKIRRQESQADALKLVHCGQTKGWGVFAKHKLSQGVFLVEYTGEVIDGEEFERRMLHDYAVKSHHYCLHLDSGLVIDAYQSGSIARFVNHSCSPNSEMQKWMVNGAYRMCLFALRDIEVGEEISYDYNFCSFNQETAQPCCCGAEDCRGIIGSRPSSSSALPPQERALSHLFGRPINNREIRFIQDNEVFLLRNYSDVRSHRLCGSSPITFLLRSTNARRSDLWHQSESTKFTNRMATFNTMRSVRTRGAMSVQNDDNLSLKVRLGQVLKELLKELSSVKTIGTLTTPDSPIPSTPNLDAPHSNKLMAQPFMKLPDPKNCREYYAMIGPQFTVALETIQRRLLKGEYTSLEEFDNDILLMLANYERFAGQCSWIGERVDQFRAFYAKKKNEYVGLYEVYTEMQFNEKDKATLLSCDKSYEQLRQARLQSLQRTLLLKRQQEETILRQVETEEKDGGSLDAQLPWLSGSGGSGPTDVPIVKPEVDDDARPSSTVEASSLITAVVEESISGTIKSLSSGESPETLVKAAIRRTKAKRKTKKYIHLEEDPSSLTCAPLSAAQCLQRGGEVIRCLCGYVMEAGEMMVQCDSCFMWQHAKCVNYALAQLFLNSCTPVMAECVSLWSAYRCPWCCSLAWLKEINIVPHNTILPFGLNNELLWTWEIPEGFAPYRTGKRRDYLSLVDDASGLCVRVGDFLYYPRQLISCLPTNCGSEVVDEEQVEHSSGNVKRRNDLVIVRIFKLWKTAKTGEKYIEGGLFLRPYDIPDWCNSAPPSPKKAASQKRVSVNDIEEATAASSSSSSAVVAAIVDSQTFRLQEVVYCLANVQLPLSHNLGQCVVLNPFTYARGRPRSLWRQSQPARSHANLLGVLPEEHVYVCQWMTQEDRSQPEELDTSYLKVDTAAYCFARFSVDPAGNVGGQVFHPPLPHRMEKRFTIPELVHLDRQEDPTVVQKIIESKSTLQEKEAQKQRKDEVKRKGQARRLRYVIARLKRKSPGVTRSESVVEDDSGTSLAMEEEEPHRRQRKNPRPVHLLEINVSMSPEVKRSTEERAKPLDHTILFNQFPEVRIQLSPLSYDLRIRFGLASPNVDLDGGHAEEDPSLSTEPIINSDINTGSSPTPPNPPLVDEIKAENVSDAESWKPPSSPPLQPGISLKEEPAELLFLPQVFSTLQELLIREDTTDCIVEFTSLIQAAEQMLICDSVREIASSSNVDSLPPCTVHHNPSLRISLFCHSVSEEIIREEACGMVPDYVCHSVSTSQPMDDMFLPFFRIASSQLCAGYFPPANSIIQQTALTSPVRSMEHSPSSSSSPSASASTGFMNNELSSFYDEIRNLEDNAGVSEVKEEKNTAQSEEANSSCALELAKAEALAKLQLLFEMNDEETASP